MDFIPEKSENKESTAAESTQRPVHADIEPSSSSSSSPSPSPESGADDQAQHLTTNSVTSNEDQETMNGQGDDETGNQVVIIVGSGDIDEEDDDDEVVLAQIIEQRALNVSVGSLANSHRSASTGGGRASVLSDSIRSVTSARRPMSLGGSHRSANSSSRGSPRRRLR